MNEFPTANRTAAPFPESLGSKRIKITTLISKWALVVVGLAALLALLKMADHSKSTGYWLTWSARTGWHLESGYLIDYSPREAHTFHLSGRWYRLGPIQIHQKWRSRIVVTNQADMDKIWKAF